MAGGYDRRVLDDLRSRVLSLQPLVDPARERARWRELLDELGIAGPLPPP